jgi:hypothetical protein
MNKQETLACAESNGAMIGASEHLREALNAQGEYRVLCRGPLERERASYIETRDALKTAYGNGEIVLAQSLWAKLDAYPQEDKWVDTIKNLVTTVGKNNILDNHLSGSAYTATWFIGLLSATGFTGVAAADTMASHAGWTESVAYSNAARPTAAWSAAAAGSKTLSSGAVFNINATDTIKGCFLNSVATKSGTTGTLYSAGLFTGGDQPVVNGNTLTVTYTASV